MRPSIGTGAVRPGPPSSTLDRNAEEKLHARSLMPLGTGFG